MEQWKLEELFEERAAKGDGAFAIAHALLLLAKAQDRTATQLKNLGLADAATPMGAIEILSVEFKRIADSLDRMADRQEQDD